VCFGFWFTASGVLPQLAKFPKGFQLDVSHSPMHIIVFQILKILVGGFFTIAQQGGVLIEKQK
jgi:hypothetical protein